MRPSYIQDGSTVEVKNGNVSEALRAFKRQLKNQNLFIELKNHREFKKPSRKRREALNIGKRRQQFKLMQEFWQLPRLIYISLLQIKPFELICFIA